LKEISPDLFDKEKSRTNFAVPLRGSASPSEKVLKKVAKKFGGKKKRLYFCTPKHGKSKVKVKFWLRLNQLNISVGRDTVESNVL
jgi:hypothetical protein